MLASTKDNLDSKWNRSFQCAIQCHQTYAYFSFSHQVWKIKENTLLNFCLVLKLKKNTKKINFKKKKKQMYEQSNLMKKIIIHMRYTKDSFLFMG